MDSLSHALCQPLHFNHQPYPYGSYCDQPDLYFVALHFGINHRAHHVTCYRAVLLNLNPSLVYDHLCPWRANIDAVHSFPARPQRKGSSRASPHIWMTQRLEARVARLVGGGFIPFLPCFQIVPFGLTHCFFRTADTSGIKS